MTRCHCWSCPHGHNPALSGATLSHGIRVKVMSIHGCHVAPSSQRSHLAVMVALSALTVSVDRTIPLAAQRLPCEFGFDARATARMRRNGRRGFIDPSAAVIAVHANANRKTRRFDLRTLVRRCAFK